MILMLTFGCVLRGLTLGLRSNMMTTENENEQLETARRLGIGLLVLLLGFAALFAIAGAALTKLFH